MFAESRSTCPPSPGHELVVPRSVDDSPTPRPISHGSPEIVYVAGLDGAVAQRIESILNTVGTEVVCISHPDDLCRSGESRSHSCLVLSPSRLADRPSRWLNHSSVIHRRLPVVCFDLWTSIPAVVELMRSGIWSCLEATVSDHEILETIQQALQEDGRRRSQFELGAYWRSRFDLLSAREQEIFALTIEGLTSKEIGRRLGISGRTVEAHRATILRKVAVNRLSEAVLPYCLLMQS